MRQPRKETIRAAAAAIGLAIALAGCAGIEVGTERAFTARFTTGEIRTVTLPRATQSDQALYYTIDDVCPLAAHGLRFREDPTPVIAGTPSEAGTFQCELSWYRNQDGPPIDHRTIDIIIEQGAEEIVLEQTDLTLSTLSDTSFSLTPATGGNGTFSYQLRCTPTLPTEIQTTWTESWRGGLDISVPPTLHGTAKENFSSACRYSATSAGETAATTFTVSASDEVEPDPNEPLTLVQSSIALSTLSTLSFALADAAGGEGTYTYDLRCTPTLPQTIEVTWSSSRRDIPPVLYGRPKANFSSACRYTATSGEEITAASFNVSATDEVAPEPGVPLTLNQLSIEFSTLSASSFALADAEGGLGSESYFYDLRCTPELPLELTIAWDRHSGNTPPILHGTAEANFSSTCRYTVTSGEETATTAFTISATDEQEPEPGEPLGLVQPSILFSTLSSLSFPLADATGGTEPYAYDLRCTPALPSEIEVTWDRYRRVTPPVIHGKPEANFSSACRYTVTSGEETAAASFIVWASDEIPPEPEEPLALVQTSITFSTLSATSFALADATGATPPYAYRLTCTPSLPSAIEISWSGSPDRTIPPILYGTAPENFSSTCRYTARSGAETTTATFNISTSDEQEPEPGEPLVLVQPDILFSTLSESSFALAAATGADGAQSYRYRLECTPELPDGITIAWDETQTYALPPIVHGMARENFSSACRYTVRSGTETVRVSFEASATDEEDPDEPEAPDPIILIQQSITFSTQSERSFSLNDATGGIGEYSYSLTCAPSMPDGIQSTWGNPNAGTGSIPPTYYGRATENFSSTCRYTVTSGQQTTSASFTISATDEQAPDPSEPLALVQPDILFSTLSESSFALAAATGADGAQSYRYRLECTPELPDGITIAWDETQTYALPPIVHGMARENFSSACRYTVRSGTETVRVSFEASATDEVEEEPTPTEPIALTQQSLVFSTESALAFTLASATGGGGAGDYPYRYGLECDPDVLGIVGIEGRNKDSTSGIDIVWDRIHTRALPPVLRGEATEGFSSACIYTVRSVGENRETKETTRTTFNISAQAQQNPVHNALLADYGRRTTVGSGDAIDRTVATWARSAYRYKTSLVTPDVSTGSIGAELGGFDMTGTSTALDVTAVTPVGEDWLIGVNTRLTDTESTYHARADGLRLVGYTRGDYGAETLTAAPFIAGRMPGGTYAFAGIGTGFGTMYHRDLDSPHSTWRQQSTSTLKLRTWHAGLGRPLGDIVGGTVDFATRVDGFTLDARKNAVMQRDFGFEGSTWTAGGSWRHKSLLQPSLQLDWERHDGDGAYGSQLAAGAGIDAAGIGHPRLTITLDARHTWAIDTSADDSWRLRGGLRWGAGEMERGLSADIGTTIHTEDDDSMKIFGGEIRWRDMPATKLGLIELYGGFDQLAGGHTRQRLGLRLPRERGPIIGTEAWHEPELDDFGARLTLRNELR